MNTWDDVRNFVQTRPGRGSTFQSNQRWLMYVIDAAEAHQLNPKFALKASYSNLKDIIREARRAIRWQNWGDLGHLFFLAGTLTNLELRLALHQNEVERIYVMQVENTYMLELTKEQFERVQFQTRARHEYVLS